MFIKLWLVGTFLAFLLSCIENWRVDSFDDRYSIGESLCFLHVQFGEIIKSYTKPFSVISYKNNKAFGNRTEGQKRGEIK